MASKRFRAHSLSATCGGSGLRAGQKAVMPGIPCHGDVFHIQQQFEQVAHGLARQAQGSTTRRIKLGQTIAQTKLTGKMTQRLTIQQVQANRRARGLVARARDVKILLQWFELCRSFSQVPHIIHLVL